MDSILLQTQAAGSVPSCLKPGTKADSHLFPPLGNSARRRQGVTPGFCSVFSSLQTIGKGLRMRLRSAAKLGSRHTAVLMAQVVVWEFWGTSLVMLSLDKLSWLLACLRKAGLCPSLSQRPTLSSKPNPTSTSLA